MSTLLMILKGFGDYNEKIINFWLYDGYGWSREGFT